MVDRIEPQREFAQLGELVTVITVTHRGERLHGVLAETHDRVGRVQDATLLLGPLSALLDAISSMRAALDESPLPSELARIGAAAEQT